MADEVSHTKTWQRVAVFAIALLFILTSATLTIFALMDSSGSSDTSNDKASQLLQGTILKGFTPVSEVKELKTTDLKKGSGVSVKQGATVTVNYTGAVAATGVIFQSSLDTGQPAAFSLDKVIKGWTEGIPGMKIGGERQLLIPADLAYGNNPPPNSGIPADAPLVFDVTLLSIDKN